MGEAAPCLMRSVSQPLFASCELKEGDPLRALTTSISFGRFLTEPLDWERWSSFSHNRILEDVKKHSRPGAVAEKKAFFEAYYNRYAAKKSAKSTNKENKPPNCYTADENIQSDTGAEMEITSKEDVSSPSTKTDLVLSENGNDDDNITSSAGQKQQEKASTKDVLSEPNRFEDNEDVCLPSTKTNIVSSEIGNADHIIASNAGQVEHEKPSINLVFSESGNVEDNVPSDTGAEMELISNEEIGNVDDIIPSTAQVEQENLVFSVLDDKNKKRQIKDKILSEQKKPEISSVKSSVRKSAAPAVRPLKTARDVKEKKRPALQSLHISMNFPSRNKNGTSNTLGKPKETLIEVLSGSRVKKNSQAPPRPENKSFSEASTAYTKKPRSTTTVPSSFSFRSEERAAKRKEFFQKLGEKGNTKETEKNNLQPKLKEKARNDNKKLRRTTVIEAKPSEAKGPSNNSIHKSSPTLSCIPKLGRKLTPRLVENEDACYQPSKPKNFIEINKKKISSSMASLPFKKRHAYNSALMSKK